MDIIFLIDQVKNISYLTISLNVSSNDIKWIGRNLNPNLINTESVRDGNTAETDRQAPGERDVLLPTEKSHLCRR